jgi:hypothetical protein
LWDAPTQVDDSWNPLGELSGDKTEFEADAKNKLLNRASSGLQFRIEEDGKLKNDYMVEKISIFYKTDRARLL